jgi:hypothetical protein
VPAPRPSLHACMQYVRWADLLGSSVPPIFFAADEGTQFKEAASFVFAAAERASPSTPARSTGSPHTVRISEHGSAFDGTTAPYPLSPDACSSPSSTSRSVAYRPVLADQIRAAILYARPHTLASAQRQGCLMQGRLEPTAGRRRMPLDPFKKVVVGRAVTAPLLQVSAMYVHGAFPCLFASHSAFRSAVFPSDRSGTCARGCSCSGSLQSVLP